MQNKIIILLFLAVISICTYVGLTAREGRTPAPFPPPPFPVAEKDEDDAAPDDEGDEQAVAKEPEKGQAPAPWLIAKKGGSIADTIPPPFPPGNDKRPLVGESPGLIASMPRSTEPKPSGPPVQVPGPKDGLPRIFEGPLAQANPPTPPVMIEPDAPPPSFPPVEPKSPPASPPKAPVESPVPPTPVETPSPLPPTTPPVPEKKKESSVPAPEATPIAPPTSEPALPIVPPAPPEPAAPPKAPDGPPAGPKPPVPVAPPKSAPVVPPPAAPEVAPVAPPKTEVPAPKNDPLPVVPPPVVPEPAPLAPPKVDAKVEIPVVPKSEPAVPVVPPPLVPEPAPVAPPSPMVEVPMPKTEHAPGVAPKVVETPPPPAEPMRNKIAFPPIPAIPEPAAPATVPDVKPEVPLPSEFVKPQIPTMPRYSRPGVSAGTPEPVETKKVEPAPALPLVPMAETNIPAAEPKRPPAFRLVNPVRRSDPIPLPNERQFVFPGNNNNAAPPMTPVAPAPREKEPDTGPPLPKIISQDPTERTRESTSPMVADEPQTVPITVEKVGPMNMKAGELLSFEIVLRNPGSQIANLVRVEDEIPQGTRFLKSDMTPIVSGGKLSWTVASIPAAGEKRLRVQLQAMANGSCVGATSVMVTAPSVSARTPNQPMLVDSARNLDVQVSGPTQVNVGQQVVWEVTVVNNAAQPASDMILHIAIPAGLKHPVAQNIEGDVGVLAPGAKKTIRVATTGVSSGRHTINVKITANNGQEVSAHATVNVGSVGLQINQSPSHRLILEKPNEIRIEILNFHSQTMRNISVIDTLPSEVDFISATELGIYRSSSRVVSWLIDQLEPGQSKVLVLQLKPKRPGTWNHEVIATAKPAFEARSQAALQVEGYADLNVKIVGRDPQLEVGKETIYQVRVINQGNVPATNIQLQALLPEGMRSGHAQGPTAFQGQGNQINFAPIGKLNPQAQVVYHIGVIAQSPGDRRFRVQVTSDQHQQPIAREERTVVYRE